MSRLPSRRAFLQTFCVTSACLTTGCGTLLYPERRGQKGGRLDWKVVALDTAGLLLFFIPGVIAFAVDIMEGTIYLPPEEYGYGNQQTPAATTEAGFVSVAVPEQDLNQAGIARIVAERTGKKIELAEGSYATSRIDSLEAFETARQELAQKFPSVS